MRFHIVRHWTQILFGFGWSSGKILPTKFFQIAFLFWIFEWDFTDMKELDRMTKTISEEKK